MCVCPVCRNAWLCFRDSGRNQTIGVLCTSTSFIFHLAFDYLLQASSIYYYLGRGITLVAAITDMLIRADGKSCNERDVDSSIDVHGKL